MKKKIITAAAITVMALACTACGSDDVKVVDNSSSGTTTESPSDQTDDNSAADENYDGYVFESNGVKFGPDMDAAKVVEALGGEPKYFEAASCAFEGLDKIYTYEHFEIDTYPDQGKDKISLILIKDDLVSTPEGISIGKTLDDVVAAYGESYKNDGNMYVYAKGSMTVSFLIENDTVTSIQYDSTTAKDAIAASGQ